MYSVNTSLFPDGLVLNSFDDSSLLPFCFGGTFMVEVMLTTGIVFARVEMFIMFVFYFQNFDL